MIPHVYSGQERTFFFVQYAGYRQRLGEPALFPVPTAQNRQGIVTIKGANGQPDQLTVPLNAVAQTVMSRYPLPNDPAGPFGPGTYNSNASLPINRDQWSARMDHRFSSKDSIYGRYTWSNNIMGATDPVALTEASNFSELTRYNQRNLGVTETHIASPTLLNSFTFGYLMNDEFIGPGTIQFPQFTFSDGSLGSWGPDTGLFDLHPETFDFNDKVNWTKNAHSISLGFSFQRVRDDEYGASIGGPNGQYIFQLGTPLSVAIPSASGDNNLAAGTPSPSSLISFMLGQAAAYQRTLAFPGFGPPGGGYAPFGIRRSTLAGWFQDDVKVMSKLTLNLGLRYEYNSVPYEVANRMAGIIDNPAIAGGSVYRMLVMNPQPVYRPDHTGFGPRFGLAYKVTPATVFRGGFGIFTNVPLIQFADQEAFNFPFAAYGTRYNPPMSLTPLPVSGLPTVTDLQGNPLPSGGNTKNLKPNTPVNLQPVEAFFGGPLILDLDSTSLRNGYTMSGNVTLERQLPGDIAFQMAYVMNNAARLYGNEYPNAYAGAQPQYTPYTLADPGLGMVQLADNHAHSTYNALQTSARKVSPTHGITFQISYTWSKAIDSVGTVYNGPGGQSGGSYNNPFCMGCEKSVSGFDFTQRFVANFIYQLPFEQWKALSFAPKRVTRGWEMTSIIQAQSGFPFTVNSPFGTQEYGTLPWGYQGTRPNLVQKATLNTGGAPQEDLFSSAVIADGQGLGQQYFATPGGQTTGLQDYPGNLGRNTFRTRCFSNFDVSLIKDTTLVEGKTLQFRAEFFNLFNQHAFGVPSGVLGSPGFGIASGTVLAERQIQFALRLVF
ncbi:MAG: TonB-dependent receptor [Terriglobia bacterium]